MVDDTTSRTTERRMLFWDDADTETSATDIADILDGYADGDIVEVQRAVQLTNIFAVRIGDDEGHFDTLEEAEAWTVAKGVANV